MLAEKRQGLLKTILLVATAWLLALFPVPASADGMASYGRVVSDSLLRTPPYPASRVLAAIDLPGARGAGVSGAPVIDVDGEPPGGDPVDWCESACKIDPPATLASALDSAEE